MVEIISVQAMEAVSAFLQDQFDKKTTTQQKQLEKAKEKNNSAQVIKLEAELANVKQKFTKESWLPKAADKMAKQLKFGTHISKGIHPDAKGDNICFKGDGSVPDNIIGSHSINSNLIDANGNAAALPLAAFFDFTVDEKTKIRDLILSNNADFIASLAPDRELAQAYHQAFKTTLTNEVSHPVTHERNKQMLWPMNAYNGDNLEALFYTVLVPLYPSVFVHGVCQKINYLLYSDVNKTARQNRFKKTAQQQQYVSILDLAQVQLGGTKPQNVSQLVSKQGGRSYLLPSVPPVVEHSYSFKLSKFATSIFDKSLTYQARKPLKDIFSVVNSKKNNVHIRQKRQDAIDAVLHVLFSIAKKTQRELPGGWSKDYQFPRHEKLWLDPKRAKLEGEQIFAEERENTDWHQLVIADFSRWLNNLLKAEFPRYKFDFGDPEYHQWKRDITAMRKLYERAGKGVFL